MIHIGHIIERELHLQERSVSWFARKLYCDRTNVYKIFRKSSIDAELLLRISFILNRNFFSYYIKEYKERDASLLFPREESAPIPVKEKSKTRIDK